MERVCLGDEDVDPAVSVVVRRREAVGRSVGIIREVGRESPLLSGVDEPPVGRRKEQSVRSDSNAERQEVQPTVPIEIHEGRTR